jgi:hypothetical protein
VARGTFSVPSRAVQLADVEAAWADTSSRERLVVVP